MGTRAVMISVQERINGEETVDLTRKQKSALHEAASEYGMALDRLLILQEMAGDDKSMQVLIRRALGHVEKAHSKVSYVVMAESLKGW